MSPRLRLRVNNSEVNNQQQGINDSTRTTRSRVRKTVKRRTRGRWTDERDKALLQSYVYFRPHRTARLYRYRQWAKVQKEVNKLCITDNHPPLALKSMNARIKMLLSKYDFSTQHQGRREGMENLTYLAWKAWEQDVEVTGEKKAKKHPRDASSASSNESPLADIKQEEVSEEEDMTNSNAASTPEPTEHYHDLHKQYAELAEAINKQTKEIKRISSVLKCVVAAITKPKAERYD